MTEDKSQLTILVLETNPSVLKAIKEVLIDKGYLVLPYSEGRKVIEDVNKGIEYPIINANNKLIDNNNQTNTFFLIICSMLYKTIIYDIKTN